LPAIGPVIAGGVLASVLASAAGGAAVAGIVGALIGMGVPEEEAAYYESEFRSGRTLVTVQADGRYDEVVALLRRHGAAEMMPYTPAAHRTLDVPVRPADVSGTPTGTTAGGEEVRVGGETHIPIKDQNL